MVQAQPDLINPDFQGDVSAKVTIVATGVGNAPKLKTSKFATKEDNLFSKINVYLRKQLNLQPADALYLFIKNSF